MFTWFSIFGRISPDILNRAIFSLYESSACTDHGYLKGRCHGNQIICERQVRHGPKNWHILSNISDLLDRFFANFSPYESTLCTDNGSVPFSKFDEIPSSSLRVYAVKTRNFCRHAPAILGRSSYATLAFWNGLEDCNFDFSRAEAFEAVYWLADLLQQTWPPAEWLSLIHIWRCRRSYACRSRWSPYH